MLRRLRPNQICGVWRNTKNFAASANHDISAGSRISILHLGSIVSFFCLFESFYKSFFLPFRFFTGADHEVVGFFKGNGDFNKPSLYALPDISKLMKPLPYVVLSKVHDSLHKIRLFLMRNDPDFRFGLIWKGKAHLEIFAKENSANGAISSTIRNFLLTQCKELNENDAGPVLPPPSTTQNE